MSVTVNRVVASLARDQRLKLLHTFLRAQHDEDPEKVNLDYIMDKEMAELEDIDSSKRFMQTSEPSHAEGDPVATLASCNFAKANKHNYPPRDKQPQTRSPISKSSRPILLMLLMMVKSLLTFRQKWMTQRSTHQPSKQLSIRQRLTIFCRWRMIWSSLWRNHISFRRSFEHKIKTGQSKVRKSWIPFFSWMS